MATQLPSVSYAPLTAVSFLVAYVALDWVSFVHAWAPVGITPWNPQPGLSLALLLVRGLSWVPLVVAAPLIADLLVRGLPAPWLPSIAAALVIACGYGMAAYVLRKFVRADRFGRVEDVLLLLGISAAAVLFVALGYVGVFILAGVLPARDFVGAAARFWIGDMIGIAVVTPLALIALMPWRLPRLGWEAAAQAGLLGLVLWIVFGVEATDEFQFFYLLFLPLGWIAVRHGLPGAAVSAAATQSGMMLAFAVAGQPAAKVTALQFLMLALAASALVLGAAITARREAEARRREDQARLAHFARMSAAGELASALAHELNQPLTAVINFARGCKRLLAMEPLDRTRLAEAIDKAAEQAERAGEIIRRLRDFVRKGDSRPAPTDMGAVIVDVIGLVAADARQHGIDITVLLAEDLPPAMADRIQIEQVLMNLVRNGMDALASVAGPKRLCVSAQPDGGGVAVSVSDTGGGIAAAMVAQLFTAFATTKPGGMGLGLAISRGLVEAQGGRLWLEKSDAGGTTFRFTVPAAEMRP